MIVAIDQSPPAVVQSAESLLLHGFRDISTSQGPDGGVVRDNFRHALEHWFRRSEWLIANSGDGVFESTPVPVRIVGTIRVRYVDGGRIAPLPYPVDEE